VNMKVRLPRDMHEWPIWSMTQKPRIEHECQ
jgi:hypothetical protein